jgi:hypothetical protein
MMSYVLHTSCMPSICNPHLSSRPPSQGNPAVLVVEIMLCVSTLFSIPIFMFPVFEVSRPETLTHHSPHHSPIIVVSCDLT